jgi:hypothetical protein
LGIRAEVRRSAGARSDLTNTANPLQGSKEETNDVNPRWQVSVTRCSRHA